MQGNPNPPNQWQPGQSGNPHGRPPKGWSITDVMKEMLSEKPEIKKALCTKLLELALKKEDITAIKLLWQYMDGMPNQKVEMDGQLGNPSIDNLTQAVTALALKNKPNDGNSGTSQTSV